MEGHGEIAFGTEGLPATFFADGKRRGAATIMKNESLMFSLEVFFDSCQKLVGEVTVFKKIGAFFKIDDSYFGSDSGRFGFFGKFDEGMMGFGKVKIDDVRGGGTLNTGNIEGFGNKASKSDGGITRGILLIIGRFMRFIDHNKAKISEWGKEGGARADND